MKLEKEQLEKILKRLNQISNPPRPCNVCGNSQWNVVDTVFEVREFHEGNVVIGGDSKIIPIITMSCSTCGNTVFLNAILMGIIVPNDPKQNIEK